MSPRYCDVHAPPKQSLEEMRQAQAEPPKEKQVMAWHVFFIVMLLYYIYLYIFMMFMAHGLRFSADQRGEADVRQSQLKNKASTRLKTLQQITSRTA